MPDKKGKKSPKVSQPKKKKRRVKSDKENKEDKGHNQNTNSESAGVSTVIDQNTPRPYDFSTQTLNTNFSFGVSNMAQFQSSQPMQTQQQPMPVAGMAPAGWYSPPPQLQGSGPGPGPPVVMGQAMNYKPDWASELIDSVKQMQSELGKLSGIEKSLSGITLKLSSLESKVGTMETKVNNCEKACNFLSDKYDTQKKDIEKTQSDIKNSKSEIAGLKTRCDAIETKSREQQTESSKLQRKLYDLETRNMRDNLVFHDLPESATENCEQLVKLFMEEKLHMNHTDVENIVFDRIHRIGRPENLRPGNIRPIVGKFHRYREREAVRQIGYDKRDALKLENMAVRPQLPQEVLDKRKPLYSVFEKAKNDGARVKFVLDKLYINGREYIPPL